MVKIKKGNPPRLSKHIPPAPKPDGQESLVFSFKHLDLHGNAKFTIAECGPEYLDKYLGRLRDLSSMRIKEFTAKRSKSLKIYPIDWAETTEPKSFTCLSLQLRDEQPWQFQITANEHGRVHGFLIGRTFFVVWLDPCHNLYS